MGEKENQRLSSEAVIHKNTIINLTADAAAKELVEDQIYSQGQEDTERGTDMAKEMQTGEQFYDNLLEGSISETTAGIRSGDWLQHFDEQGQEYWVNVITGESQWELPDGGISQYSEGN